MDLFLPISSLIGIWFLVVTIPGPNFVAVTQCSMAESRIDGFRGIHGCGYMGDGQPAGLGCCFYSFALALRHHTIGGRIVSDVHRAQDHSGSFLFFAIFSYGKSIARFKICCFPSGLINQLFQPENSSLFWESFCGNDSSPGPCLDICCHHCPYCLCFGHLVQHGGVLFFH